MNNTIWLIGAGPIAQAYAAVLKDLGIIFRVIGRGHSSAKSFLEKTGIDVFKGGLRLAIDNFGAPNKAILAVNIDQASSLASLLVESGCKSLLIEKPGALYLDELIDLNSRANKSNASVWIAYNRRFYASVVKIQELIKDKTSISSLHFEFTEFSGKIAKSSKHSIAEKKHWVTQNSSHVIDLAFWFIGLPESNKYSFWYDGSLDWHPSASKFTGAGLSVHGIPFCYHADWNAPGRWCMKLMTDHRIYILQPFEKLKVIEPGSFDAKEINIDYSYDLKYKPGFYLQCKAFISNDISSLAHLNEHIKLMKICYSMAGYTPFGEDD